MITVWNGHRNCPHFSASAHPSDEQPPQSWKMISWQHLFCQPSTFDYGLHFGKNSFLNEQCGNIIENKGSLRKKSGPSGNVYEKTGA
jgi:hypothetical protein